MKYLLHVTMVLLLCACSSSEKPTGQVDLAGLHGQWVVINYWAQWCKPCIKEIPELNELDQAFTGVTVLGVNFDGLTGEELQEQEKELGVTFKSLSPDPAEDLGIARPLALPTTLILNPAGELIATLVGPQTLESLARITGQTLTEH